MAFALLHRFMCTALQHLRQVVLGICAKKFAPGSMFPFLFCAFFWHYFLIDYHSFLWFLIIIWLDQLDWTSPYPGSYIRSVTFWGIWLMPQDIWILTIDSAALIWIILLLKGKYLAFHLDRSFSILLTKCFQRGLEAAPMQSGRPRLVEGSALASQCISSARASSL